MKTDTLKKQLEDLIKFSDDISENTELYSYIKQINDSMYSNGERKIFEEKYKEIVDGVEKERSSVPFLSVIIRTQGNRPIGLRESLLCLRAQSNQDFEVILIGHKVDKANVALIHEVIEEQPSGFKNKIKYIPLNEGTRTTPINIGFANALGKYISVFDDDDLLFDNWVEKFYEASKDNDGKILHAFALAQKWKEIKVNQDDINNRICYTAIEAPTSQFCVKFDYLTQLVINRCPLMSLAFPSYIFRKLGIIFNENLNVTEDWEYFMRVVAITGIIDIEEATSIYRLWVNAETSATLHNQVTWLDTYLNIQKKMNDKSLLVPKGYTTHIISLIQRNQEDKLKMPSGFPKLQGILYYGENEEFSDEKMIISYNNVYSPKMEMIFNLPTESYESLQNFRIDPCEYGGFILEGAQIIMNTEMGGKIEVLLNDCRHNGIWCKTGIYFVHYDPQIAWKYEGLDKIVSISITGEINMEIPEELVNTGINYYSENGKLKRKVKRLMYKIIGRRS